MPRSNNTNAETTTETKEVKSTDYKVLVKWNGGGMLTIPLSTGTVLFYPGYNTIMNTEMEECYNLCKELFGNNKMAFHGENIVEDEDGAIKFKQSVALKKMTMKNLAPIIKETVNPKTLKDLSDPHWISNTYVAQASVLVKQKEDEISQYTGVAPTEEADETIE